MNIEQIEKRLAEIAEELRGGNADVEALERAENSRGGQKEHGAENRLRRRHENRRTDNEH